jgi:hypothetical protein
MIAFQDPIPPRPDVLCFEPHGVVLWLLGRTTSGRRVHLASRRCGRLASYGAGELHEPQFNIGFDL